jgi:hypothetical protein
MTQPVRSVLRSVFWLQLFFVLFLCHRAQAARPCGTAQLYAKTSVHGYLFKSYKTLNIELTCMIVYRHGHEVYRMVSHNVEQYDLGQPAQPEYKIPLVEDGADLTGSGRPDMIVNAWTGGAHCCFTKYVLELEPRLRVIAKVEDGDTDLGHFEQLPEGSYEYMTWDIWSYWPMSFAGSANHSVMLHWDGGKLRLDAERMEKPPPTSQEWQTALDAVDEVVKDNGDRGQFAGPLWDKVLDLIYTGHSELAWKFLREVNPASMKSPNASLEEFCSEMTGSVYWPELKTMLRDVPPECAAGLKENAKSRR